MKQNTFFVNVWTLMLILGLIACGEKKTQVKTELQRIEAFAFDVNDDYLQSYAGTFCYSTSARMDGKECLIVYNGKLHSIDILNLADRRPLKQIALAKDGPDQILAPKGIGYYKDSFIILNTGGLYRVGQDGKVVSKKLLNDFPQIKEEGYGIAVPDLTVYFSVYSFFGFDAANGRVALPLYFYEKDTTGEYPKKVLIVSCDDWNIRDEVEIHCPDVIRKEGDMQLLGCVNVLPYGDRLIYNFPASSKVYVYDLSVKKSKEYDFPSTFTDPFFHLPDINGSEPGFGCLKTGYYFPLCYDAYHNVFWRIQQGPLDGHGVGGKPFSVMCMSPDFLNSAEYVIPAGASIYPDLAFTDSLILLPYTGGDKIGENNMCFYGLQYRE